MSTKNLAHTLIEPGRAGYTKANIRNANRGNRQRARVALRLHGEDADIPKQKPEGEIGGDEFGPVLKWLDAHVGRSWAKTYSKLCELFPKKSLRGFHLHDHVRGWVEPHLFMGENLARYVVDRRGILRRNRRSWER